MIHYRSGNILHARDEALVNPVNCVGVKGRGLTLHFKRAFPDNFDAYVEACHGRAVRPGRMFVFENGDTGWPKFIVNFPTKRHWREP